MSQQTPSAATGEPSKHSSDYLRYIRSAKWDRRKVDYYSKHPKVCRACGTKNEIHLHHHTYRRMRHELDEDLVPLCRTCHELCHAHHRQNTGWTLTRATADFLRLNGATLRPVKKRVTRKAVVAKKRAKREAPPKPGLISREQAAQMLGIPVDAMPQADKGVHQVGWFRENVIRQWADGKRGEPPRWLREYRNHGGLPSAPPKRGRKVGGHAWYRGGGRAYSPEFQKLLDEAKQQTINRVR